MKTIEPMNKKTTLPTSWKYVSQHVTVKNIEEATRKHHQKASHLETQISQNCYRIQRLMHGVDILTSAMFELEGIQEESKEGEFINKTTGDGPEVWMQTHGENAQELRDLATQCCTEVAKIKAQLDRHKANCPSYKMKDARKAAFSEWEELKERELKLEAAKEKKTEAKDG